MYIEHKSGHSIVNRNPDIVNTNPDTGQKSGHSEHKSRHWTEIRTFLLRGQKSGHGTEIRTYTNETKFLLIKNICL